MAANTQNLPPAPPAAKRRSASDNSGLSEEDRAAAEGGKNILATFFGDGRVNAPSQTKNVETEAFRAREAERLISVVEALKLRFCISVAASVRLKRMLREEDQADDLADGGGGGGGGRTRRASYRCVTCTDPFGVAGCTAHTCTLIPETYQPVGSATFRAGSWDTQLAGHARRMSSARR